jgi:uncharacterized protein (TIGR02270 family)
LSASIQVIPEVLEQHAEELAHLRSMRRINVRAPHIRLKHLARLDERIAAHLDGLLEAGDEVWPYCEPMLELAAAGNVFAVTVVALLNRRRAPLERLLALTEAAPAAARGFFSAFGWVSAPELQGIGRELLSSEVPFRRLTGLTACSLHRVDPGLTAGRYFEDPDPVIRARAWRTAGELGARALVSTSAAAAMSDEDPGCQFWAAWASVLLGDRGRGLDVMIRAAFAPGLLSSRALQLAIQALSVDAAHALLQPLAQDPANIRLVMRGAGFAGHASYIPWLIGLMTDNKLARLAGEAFSMMTGLDLAWLDLEVKPPESFESGPNDDPNDPNVDMDEDDGLPWPDAVKIQAWWHANSQRFQPGTRYFMGEPLNRDNCVRVLKEGFQRQRIAAALHLSLLNPGTLLFEWRAPAPRQQRQLAELS